MLLNSTRNNTTETFLYRLQDLYTPPYLSNGKFTEKREKFGEVASFKFGSLEINLCVQFKGQDFTLRLHTTIDIWAYVLFECH